MPDKYGYIMNTMQREADTRVTAEMALAAKARADKSGADDDELVFLTLLDQLSLSEYRRYNGLAYPSAPSREDAISQRHAAHIRDIKATARFYVCTAFLAGFCLALVLVSLL